MERKSFKIYEANLIFFLLAILFITFGASVQAWDINKGLLITEYGIILVPVILAAKLLGVDLKSALKLNPIKGRTVIRIMAISFLMLPIVALSNLIPIAVLSLFDKVSIPQIPTPDTPMTLLTSFFIVAISPGICEEVFFRGLILNAYETSYNNKIGAVVAAVLFGLFHFNIQNLFGPIIIGLMAAYLMQLTKSLYAAIILHMTNNGLAVFFDYIGQVYTPQNMEAASIAADFNNTSMLLNTITSMAFFAAIGLFLSRLLINGLKHDTFYYALGEPFEVNGKIHYLVGKTATEGKIISKDDAFRGSTYNLDGEQSITWRTLSRMKPVRVHSVWGDSEIAEPQHPKVYAPLVGVVGLYLYIMYLFMTYTG